MTIADVLTLYDYDEWANARFVAALAALDDERLRTPVESSFPSLLATFGHLVAAEWIWLRRWQGESPTAFPPWHDEPALDDLRSRLRELEAERREYLGGLTDDDLAAPLGYRLLSGAPYTNCLHDLLVHVVNHSSYHRGQLTTLLRQVGGSPPATDYVLFRRG